MSMLCGLAAFALKSVTGLEADGLARWAAERFTDHTRGVPLALSLAHDRAWLALSLALAEETLLGKLGDLGRDGDLKAIRDMARGLITAQPPNFRASCLREWNAMHRAGRLKLPPLPADPTALLAHPALAVRSVDDALVCLVRDLEKDAPSLAAAALLTPPGGVPLFASAFLFFFRREMEKDAETSRGLLLDKVDLLARDQRRAFDTLEQAVRLSGDQVRQSLQQLNDEMLGELQSCRDEMRQLREALRVQPSPAESPIAVSANTEAERERLRHLRDRLRTLPADGGDAGRLAELFDATGEYKEAMAAHRESARLAKARADRAAEAEAHYKAFRDACELQDWAAAKESLALAVRLDGPRFRPFDMGRYELVRIIGAGGFGTVFECLDRDECEDDGTLVRVAIKGLKADGLERGPAEVFREARVLKQLRQSGGSRIIGVSHWCYAYRDPDRPESGRNPFIVMEYFDGETLEALVKRDGPLAVPDLLAVARQMAEALRDAHGKHLLHRDLKPGNVMARRAGAVWDVRVIDFGLAMRHDARMVNQALMSTARGRSLTGSIDFAPPEQKGRLPHVSPGPYSDVYSWGKTCQWLLFKTTEVRGPHWRRLPEGMRGPIQDLLEAATMGELEDRLKDFGEVLRRLDAIEATAPPVPPVDGKGPAPATPGPVPGTDGDVAGENLRRWVAEGGPGRWVEQNKGRWTHGEWQQLLIDLRLGRHYWPMAEDEVGKAVESAREEWRARPKAGDGITLDGMRFAWIPPGRPTAGVRGATDRGAAITAGFYMGVFPVTQAQWSRVMGAGSRPSHFRGDDLPVEQASWEDVQVFLSRMREQSRRQVRLPTEAEWEHACRAGTTAEYHGGNGEAHLREVAWFSGNSGGQTPAAPPREADGWRLRVYRAVSKAFRVFSGIQGGRTHPVGKKKPNEWGLHDMHGNVWEWCQEGNGETRVLRGGSWSSDARECRAASRVWSTRGTRDRRYGFRVCFNPD